MDSFIAKKQVMRSTNSLWRFFETNIWNYKTSTCLYSLPYVRFSYWVLWMTSDAGNQLDCDKSSNFFCGPSCRSINSPTDVLSEVFDKWKLETKHMYSWQNVKQVLGQKDNQSSVTSLPLEQPNFLIVSMKVNFAWDRVVCSVRRPISSFCLEKTIEIEWVL